MGRSLVLVRLIDLFFMDFKKVTLAGYFLHIFGIGLVLRI